jgi:hypothetical protein
MLPAFLRASPHGAVWRLFMWVSTVWCTRRAQRRGKTPRGDSATADYAGPPAGQGCAHRISIPAYAVEQQWWQSGVPKIEISLVSFIFKMMLVLYQCVSLSGSISIFYWHANKWSSISFSHWQCPSDQEFSFPRFVGLLILSLWVWRRSAIVLHYREPYGRCGIGTAELLTSSRFDAAAHHPSPPRPAVDKAGALRRCAARRLNASCDMV